MIKIICDKCGMILDCSNTCVKDFAPIGFTDIKVKVGDEWLTKYLCVECYNDYEKLRANWFNY